MKKILATILALTMIVGMSLTAFAAPFTELPATQDVEVQATFKTQTTTNNTTPVYSVNITYGAISFEYTAASNVYKWNPSTLAYDIVDGTNPGAWAGETATIEIENRSNAKVKVTPKWTAVEGVSVSPEISGAVTLESAVGCTGEGQTAEITVAKPTSGTITQDQAGKIGTITLTIEAVTEQQ